jgi:hypothetical protein
MRTPRESLLVLALLTAACLLAGVLLGLWMGLFVPGPVGSRTPTPLLISPTSTPPPEISILLLGVDSLTSAAPRLEACWVLRFNIDEPEYYLVGFSPDTQVQLRIGSPPASLAQHFADDWQIGGATSNHTREAVQVILPGLVPPQAEVVFDLPMLAHAVDMLGGIALGGQHVEGATLLNVYAGLPAGDAAARLAFQHEVLFALTQAAQAQNWTGETMRPLFYLGQKWRPPDANDSSPNWFQNLADEDLPLVKPTFSITETLPSGVVTPTP